MIRSKWPWFIALYVVLLAASFAVRSYQETPPPSAAKKFTKISIDSEPPIKFAYKEFGKRSTEESSIVLIHGSPGSADAFDGLANKLPGRHIVAVDLPGFGDSEHNIPDYSILAHAKYVESFLKSKGIDRAHFGGFSLGGGVVLHIVDRNPELVESITFISSIGVQEYELFGDYHVNHVVHGLQLGFFWALRELTPHFGVFDGMMNEYSRNFYDTDQRPLRGILSKTEQPFLIIHGKDDPLVPVEAGRENHRLVPQSVYKELDDNHFFLFMQPVKISKTLNDFWISVENDTAVTRSDAGKAEKRIAAQPFKYQILRAMGPAVLCFFLLLFFITFINTDWAALIAGVFIAQGRFGWILPTISMALAVIVSAYIWKRLGRRYSDGRNYKAFKRSIDAGDFGFGFREGFKRNADSPLEYFAGMTGFGLLRAAVVGTLAWGLAWSLITGGLLQNAATWSLLGICFVLLIVIQGVVGYIRTR